MKYLAIGNNAKTVKSDAGGEYLTAIMYLRPNDNICPMSTLAQCRAPCLNTAGRGAMSTIQEARQRKTDAFERDPQEFMVQPADDIRKAQRKAQRKGVLLAVRLNGTSDIAWENVRIDGRNLMELFPEVQFYDYTKLPGRKTPANYYLAVSYSGANKAYAKKVLRSPLAKAVVFHTVPATWNGQAVINGDANDLIFKHPKGAIIGLKAKGKARQDTSGFVVNADILATA